MQQTLPYSQYSGQSHQAALPEKDMLFTILCDLKRTCREYTTAATEANCMEVRQLFTSLLHSSLQMQANVYQLMSQQYMYNTSSAALRQDIERQIRKHQQEEQQTNHFLNSTLNSSSSYFNYSSGSQQHQPYMM
ncbi:spore coat protein [Paenibacillus sp. RC67]|uniref:spore coat protein n=1 Tax=Paenibacillus sp. RC67 TaxID=3039392 RepID=UPI0024AD5010|nr:spore coat protein [Paenibacillus sp. RC67]